MTKKAIVSIDLASMVGTMKLVPSSLRLPRGDKRLLECAVSEILLETLQHAGNIRFDGLRSNPSDPPDALFNKYRRPLRIEPLWSPEWASSVVAWVN